MKIRLVQEVAELEHRAVVARQEWENIAAFLRAQGLRPDAPHFPVANLLTSGEVTPDSEKIVISEFDVVE